MQYIYNSKIKLFFAGILFLSMYALPVLSTDRHFMVIIPSRNNSRWCERNLNALISQKYDNWHAIYINDASTDDTQQKVEDFIRGHHLENKIRLINNETRLGAMENIYRAVYMCDDWDVVVLYDGDDWFNGTNVFDVLNKAYLDKNVWLTYGSYKDHPGGRRGSCARKVPSKVIKSNKFRQSPWYTSHLRTFYAWLFKCIKPEDLQLDGKFFAMTYDQAIMHPMLEMCGKRSRYIPEILYVYNMENPCNDNKINAALQLMIENLIRAQKPYQSLKRAPQRYLPKP